MRWLVFVLTALACSVGRCEDIAAVLQRSQQLRLDRVDANAAAAGSPRAKLLREDFGALLQTLQGALQVELHVTGGPATLAETLRGDTVVASEALAELPPTERLFILAHELGHVWLQHWAQMGLLFQKWIPGAVTQQHTDAVASLLGQDASRLSHQQEFEADAFAMRLLHGLGYARADVLGVFARGGPRSDSATHPGIRRRVGALLALDLEPASASVASASAARDSAR